MGHRLLTRLALPVCLIVLAGRPCAAQAWVDEGWPGWQRDLTAQQQPDKVMDVIGLRPGMVVGEIGAQVGRFTVHLARRVGAGGRVFANDIDNNALADLRERVTRYQIPNIDVVLGRVDDPCLPPNALDMAIMVRTYHELAQPEALLRRLKTSLKPGAPVVIVDLDTEKTRHSDAKSSTAEASIRAVAEAAGYQMVAVHTFLPDDTIFVLRVASGPPVRPRSDRSAATLRRQRPGGTSWRVRAS